jgi:hypothetical protein
MPRIFVGQALMDDWLSAGRIELDGELMRFDAGGVPGSLRISPAVYFERIDGSDSDPYSVVGAVKTTEELTQLGAEHYESSVVLGDFAYTVTPGFVGVPAGPDGAEAAVDAASWQRLVSGLAGMAPEEA